MTAARGMSPHSSSPTHTVRRYATTPTARKPPPGADYTIQAAVPNSAPPALARYLDRARAFATSSSSSAGVNVHPHSSSPTNNAHMTHNLVSSHTKEHNAAAAAGGPAGRSPSSGVPSPGTPTPPRSAAPGFARISRSRTLSRGSSPTVAGTPHATTPLETVLLDPAAATVTPASSRPVLSFDRYARYRATVWFLGVGRGWAGR